MKILEVKHIEKSFNDKQILKDVSFSLNFGECLGIVGRSGCGKSTLVKIISKFIDPDSGEIIFDGENITNSSVLRKIYKKMQMIFQNPEESFNPRQTLGWSIGEPLRNHKINDIDKKIKNLLFEVGLTEEYKNRYPHEVSGGQCQRAAIARAISLSPKLLICDEATSALDIKNQQQITLLLQKLCKEKKIAMIFITHDLSIVKKIADRVIVMHDGQIVEEGTTENLINAPKSKFTQELIDADFFKKSSSQ